MNYYKLSVLLIYRNSHHNFLEKHVYVPLRSQNELIFLSPFLLNIALDHSHYEGRLISPRGRKIFKAQVSWNQYQLEVDCNTNVLISISIQSLESGTELSLVYGMIYILLRIAGFLIIHGWMSCRYYLLQSFPMRSIRILLLSIHKRTQIMGNVSSRLTVTTVTWTHRKWILII